MQEYLGPDSYTAVINGGRTLLWCGECWGKWSVEQQGSGASPTPATLFQRYDSALTMASKVAYDAQLIGLVSRPSFSLERLVRKASRFMRSWLLDAIFWQSIYFSRLEQSSEGSDYVQLVGVVVYIA
jgi:hypothetical protein